MTLLHLSGEATFNTVRLLGVALRAVCAFATSEGTAAQIELAVVEACNNVVEHAYRIQKGSIVLDLVLEEEKIVIVIHDTGETMPTTSQKEFNLDFDPKNVENLPEGGMGLFLMATIMDKWEYGTAKGRNTLTLTKYLRDDGGGKYA